MSDVDAGLDELTSDVLGPQADDQPGTDLASASPEPAAEPVGDQAPPVTEAQPTEPAAQAAQPVEQATAETYQLLGRTFTKEQLEQTIRQFPHLQKLYNERGQELERFKQQRPPEAAQPQMQPQQVQAQIRASFDQAVKQAVDQGFIEEDAAILYPNLTANLMLYRDSLTFMANQQRQMVEKIQAYEAQIEAENVANNTRTNFANNMIALSGQHEAFKPLADPATREQFLGYLVRLNLPVAAIDDPETMASQWIAYNNKNTYLGGIDTARQQQAQRQQQNAIQRRRAQGDALPGSRPSGSPPAPMTPLDELIEDALQARR